MIAIVHENKRNCEIYRMPGFSPSSNKLMSSFFIHHTTHTQVIICFVLVTTIICFLYGAMWWKICTTSVQTFQKRKLTSKHKKFGIISGVVILTCALSWIPSTFLYFSDLYQTKMTAYFAVLGLHYMITVTNPIVYILGTQGNVGQALVSTPVQYRRKISRPSMYNSETVHRNCVAGTVTITDSIHKPPIVGSKRPVPMFTSHSYPGYSGRGSLHRFNSNIESGTSLELISETDYRSTDCLADSPI